MILSTGWERGSESARCGLGGEATPSGSPRVGGEATRWNGLLGGLSTRGRDAGSLGGGFWKDSAIRSRASAWVLGAVGGVVIRRGGVALLFRLLRLFTGDDGTDCSTTAVGAGISGVEVGGFCAGGPTAFPCSCGVVAVLGTASWVWLVVGFGARASLLDSSVVSVGSND